MAVAFNQIPARARVPFTYVEFEASRAGGAGVGTRSLLIGGRLAAGATPAEAPALISSVADARRAFGAGSMLEHMVAAFRRQNQVGELWCVGLDDAGGATQSARTITVSSAATGAGTVALYIAGRRIATAIAGAATPAQVAAAINTSIQAVVGDLPVTSAVVGAVVTVTARHGGPATDLDVRVSYNPDEALPPGVAIAIASSVAGATDPDIQDALDVLSDEPYDYIANPYNAAAAMTALEADLRSRWNAAVQADGVAFTALRGTAAAATTYGNARNSPYTSVMDISTSPTPVYEWAAAVCGAVAASAAADPARPFQTLPLNGALPAPAAARRSFSERNTLLTDGISTHVVEGGACRIERMITTYQTVNMVPDEAYLDVNTPLTLSWLRRDFRQTLSAKYARFKLADDSNRLNPGQPIMTPRLGRAAAVAKFREWEAAGLVENADAFKEALVVERNQGDPNRLDFLLAPDLVNQLRVVGAQIAFAI